TERLGALAAKAAAAQAVGKATLKPVPNGGRQGQGLLELVRADLHRHVGARPDDDAALLLVHAPAAWPSTQSQDDTIVAGNRITA
ncbi:MAG: hypothetical protein ACRDNS_20270, partial [Trebonia sp.]